METPSGATTETTTAAPDGNAAANPGAESPPAATGTGEKERIAELTGSWRETQRDRDFWRDQALNKGKAEPETKVDKAKGPTGESTEADEDIKTLADFKYDEKAYGKYMRQLARDDAKREADAVRSEIKGDQTEAQKAEELSTFQERAETWAKGQKLEKIDLMFASPADGGPSVSGTMAEAIMSSEHGPEVLNYLTRNQAESRRIHKLSPVQQAREIGKLEAKFAAAPADRTVSGAPPPHETVKGASDVSVTKDPAKMSDSEWWADKQRREKAKRKA